MTDRSKPRKPATFRLDDENVVVVDGDEAGRPARGTVQITPEPEPQLPAPIDIAARRGAVLAGARCSGARSPASCCSGWASVLSI